LPEGPEGSGGTPSPLRWPHPVRAEPTLEVQVDPAAFFESVFTERTAQLRERADQLRDELAAGDGSDPGGGRADHDQG
jgi:hypothetical protein